MKPRDHKEQEEDINILIRSMEKIKILLFFPIANKSQEKFKHWLNHHPIGEKFFEFQDIYDDGLNQALVDSNIDIDGEEKCNAAMQAFVENDDQKPLIELFRKYGKLAEFYRNELKPGANDACPLVEMAEAFAAYMGTLAPTLPPGTLQFAKIRRDAALAQTRMELAMNHGNSELKKSASPLPAPSSTKTIRETPCLRPKPTAAEKKRKDSLTMLFAREARRTKPAEKKELTQGFVFAIPAPKVIRK